LMCADGPSARRGSQKRRAALPGPWSDKRPHRSIETTINSCIGLDSIQASEIFTEIVIAHMGDD
jgi:hypothetical protein